jgi:hypothetical protein
VPAIVGAGLILLGLWLLAETFTGGWRSRVPDDAAERGEHAFHLGPLPGSAAGCLRRWR